MAYITQHFDDQKIIAALKRLRPEIEFGPNSRVTEISSDAPASNGVPKLTVEVTFALTQPELDSILQASLGIN